MQRVAGSDADAAMRVGGAHRKARLADSDSLANCEQSLEAIQAQAAEAMQDALTVLDVIPRLESDDLNASGLRLGEHTAHGEGVVLVTHR